MSKNWPAITLSKAIAFVREHYSEPVTVQGLAKIAHLSVRAFERQFRQHFHTSPLQYVKQLRVRMACHALIYTNRPLAEIAVNHGFCDQSHFTRDFNRQLKMTPRQYRACYRKD